ncbi:DUF2948 family protein [Afifella sp. IM 167]|uniref:DUF2948 family protein n=1 Tax=Afifella sp. IM 167 TaxID=2033586 RepID=UPI001CCBF2F3|nr:DUF2948 family protein [Afifella sp. IM 167]MBZ8135114.1 hypothetical protein [Afifella sp. IM 167]
MASNDRLRLMAMDEEDLAILSAHVQDAVLKVGDITWLPAEKRLVLALNRFAWEATPSGKGLSRSYERRRTALHFERVEKVLSHGIDKSDKEAVLSLLAISFAAGEAPSGEVTLVFAGDATLKLAVECIEAQLSDLGPAWSTPNLPRHIAS